MWYRDAVIVSLSHNANGSHVIGAHDRSRTGTQAGQMRQSVHSPFHSVVSLNHQLRFHAHANLSHGFLKCILAGLGRFKIQRASDKGDVFVPQGREVLDCLPDTLLVVDLDIADLSDRRTNVYKYQWHFAETQVLQQRIFHAEGENSDALHPALDHAPDGTLHALRIVHGLGEQDLVVVLHRDVFEGLHNLREKRIGDFGDDQSKDASFAGDQAAGLSVRVVAEFLHNLPNPLGKFSNFSNVHKEQYSQERPTAWVNVC